VLLAEERRDESAHRAGIGDDLPADVRASIAWLMGPVVDRHRDEGRPAGLLHRNVIGARDRGRNVFSARRLD